MVRLLDKNEGGDSRDSGELFWQLSDAQFSTVAVIDKNAVLQERVSYTAYGVATHRWPHEVNNTGGVTTSGSTSDYGVISGLAGAHSGAGTTIDETTYNVAADLNRDGVIDSGDTSLFTSMGGAKSALASGLISDPSGPDNPFGYDGYVYNPDQALYTVRFRWYNATFGRWLEKDPLGVTSAGVSVVQLGHWMSARWNAELLMAGKAPLTPVVSAMRAVRPGAQYRDSAVLWSFGRSCPTRGSDPTGLSWWDDLLNWLPITSTVLNCGTIDVLYAGSKSDHAGCKRFTNRTDCACDASAAEYSCAQCLEKQSIGAISKEFGVDIDGLVRAGISIGAEVIIHKVGVENLLLRNLVHVLAIDAAVDTTCMLAKLGKIMSAARSAESAYCKCAANVRGSGV